MNENNNITSTGSENEKNIELSKPQNSGDGWKPEDVPQLTVDVYKRGEQIFVVSTVAGVNAEDLDISVDGQSLTIKGMRKKPYATQDNTILLEECFWGEFYRELTINESLNVDQITANLKNGVLEIRIPILKITSQKKISVNTN